MAPSPFPNVGAGFFAPQRFEADVYDCEVLGRIPEEIAGDFVRVGCEWFYPPKFDDDAILNADGYVSRFRIRNGRVDYTGRWIRTERFETNRAAGRQMYGYYRNGWTDEPQIRDPEHPARRTVANTAPIAHGGKLFALKEDGLPHRLDPDTLGTIGVWDFDGRYSSQTFTAHPKIDPLTGEMIAYGYEATGPASDDLFVVTIDKNGAVTREVRLKVPYVSMIHDMALTQRHILFPFCGYVTSRQRLEGGQIHWGWDRSKPAMIGILPRDGEAKDVRWFKGPSRCLMHTFNARSAGDKVILEAPFWDGNFFPFFPNVDGSQWHMPKAYVRRLTFDLASKDDGWREDILFETPVVDLGRVDTRYMSLPTRYGFTGFGDPRRPFDQRLPGEARPRMINCYGRFDFATGTLDAYFAGESHSLQECCFVPRAAEGPESDGWLIGVAQNFAEMRSELVIADAQRLHEGDVARVILPFRTTAQVHGMWVPAGTVDPV
jgi:carotenoid cleavage dioxygenase